jgi:prepilin-type N-terminal cleavage/methylation domain-containing protein
MFGRKGRKGFSLLELLAVVIILGVIAAVVIPRISYSSVTAKQNACFQNKAEINSAVERYYFDNGSLPADTSALSAYFPDGAPVCPVSGNAYSLDATTKRVTSHSGSTHP